MNDQFVSTSTAGKSRKQGQSLICLTALSLAIGAVNTYAQSGGSVALEEIIVTATRREEGLQTIPASITAVTAEDLANKGITGFKDLGDTVSGLTLSQPAAATTASVYLRGVGTAGNSPAAQSVGILIDDVYQIRSGGAFTELMDIERVEVMRGPQGTLFGKNTTAGVIRVTTADPDSTEFSGQVQGVAGNLDTGEVRGLVNIPLIEDVLAARISAYTSEREGYTDNLYVGEDTRSSDKEGWRAKLLWQATEDFSVKVTGEQHHQKGDLDAGLVKYGSVFSPAQISQLPPLSVGNYQQQHQEYDDNTERWVINLNWDVAGHTLKTISSMEDINLSQWNDQDQTILLGYPLNGNIAFLQNVGDTDVITHEVQLSSNNDGALNYVMGYFFQNEVLSSDTTLYGATGVGTPRPTTLRDQDNNAIFGTIFYDFNDQWSLSAGARYTEDEQQGSNRRLDPVAGTAIHTEEFDETTWSTKLSYQMDTDKMFYLAVDKGFKSGGVNREFGRCATSPTAPCLAANQATWDPETSYNYELGMKSEWLENTLRFNASLFHQEYEDFQVTENILAESNVVVTNAAEVVADGIEAELVWVASDLLTFNGTATWAVVEYDKYNTAPCPTATSPGCVGGVQDLSGEQLDHAPELSFNAGAELRDALPQANGMEWFARLDVIYRSEQNLYLTQPAAAEQDGYAYANTRVGIEMTDSWKLAFWGNNLFDEDYLAEASVASSGVIQIPGMPRTYGVTADWFF